MQRSDEILDSWTIEEHEVLNELRKLDTKKAMGPDGINGQLLKGTARSSAPILTRIFNRSLRCKSFPQHWKLANVTPIYKKGDKQNPINYRPVSLLCITSKVFEKLIFHRLYDHCMSNNLLTTKNSGFHKKDGTINQLIFLVHNIHANLDRRNDTCMVFLDQSRAFDRIWHKGLLHKLDAIGVSNDLLAWFESYLASRKIRVTIDGQSSDIYRISAGVPQGSILGPLLFLIYINDITTDIECNISLYADDTCLYTDINTEDHLVKEAMLNRDLARLQLWSEKWFMLFNPLKTEYVHFSSRRVPSFTTNLALNNTILQSVDSHKHLGLILTSQLDFGAHIDYIVSKCSSWIGLIWKIQRKYPRHCLENIYTAYIRPIIEYGHIIYNNISTQHSRRLENLQRKAAIACTGAYVNTSHEKLLQELGWPTLSERRNYAQLIMLYKMNNNLVPQYLSSLLPTRRHQISNYNMRNPTNLIIEHTRTQSFKKSFIPASLSLWNNLPEHIRSSTTLTEFKRNTKPSVIKKREYSRGIGSGSIHLTRFRMNMSGLKSHLYACNIVDSDICGCGANNVEDVDHFIWLCPRHQGPRLTMTNSLISAGTITYIPVTPRERKSITKLLIHGDDNISTQENRTIFTIIEQYIISSQRFS